MKLKNENLKYKMFGTNQISEPKIYHPVKFIKSENWLHFFHLDNYNEFRLK